VVESTVLFGLLRPARVAEGRSSKPEVQGRVSDWECSQAFPPSKIIGMIGTRRTQLAEMTIVQMCLLFGLFIEHYVLGALRLFVQLEPGLIA